MIPIAGVNAKDPNATTLDATEMIDTTKAASITDVMRGNVTGNAIVKETVVTIDVVAKMTLMITWRHTLTSSLRISRKTKRKMEPMLMMKATSSFGTGSNGYQDCVKKPTSINGKST